MKLISLLFIALLFCSFSEAGNSVGNGGDMVAAEFVKTARDALDTLGHSSIVQYQANLLKKLNETMEATLVRSQEVVFLNGFYVDAANYPKDKLIVVSRNRWQWNKTMMAKKTRIQLVLHEYLGAAGLNDVQYVISRKLIEAVNIFP